MIPPVNAQVLLDRAQRHLRYSLGVRREHATPADLSTAFSLALRDDLIDGMFATQDRQRAAGAKRVCYLSMEYLMGRSLTNNLVNLRLLDAFRSAALDFGLDPEQLMTAEPDAALGNGGLGRLAACFLDSLATLGLPACGYGLRYEYGLFRQEFVRGHQHEAPDYWGAQESPWLIRGSGEEFMVPVYGRIYDPIPDDIDQQAWMDWRLIIGVPFDMPIVGYGGRTVNTLRLYAARSSRDFDIDIFNQGDYIKAVRQKDEDETVSKVLYPSDAVAQGRELRLLQEYFLVACALRDITDCFFRDYSDVRLLPDKIAIQLNDTHPSLAVAELMRILMDERGQTRETAWEITRATCGYTNHTLLPEALEKWPVELLGRVLPRHLQIIYEMNHFFLKDVAARWPDDAARLTRMSLVEEEPIKQVRMAHLAIVGSHAVNGVAKLHSRLVRETLVPDFAEMFPERFQNKTNGVTQRRWLLAANPGLARLITSRIGDEWVTDATQWRRLEALVDDDTFLDQLAQVKQANKTALTQLVERETGAIVNPLGLFSVHAKRIHEYKRQLLHALYIIDRYLRIAEDGYEPPVTRTFLVAGKAAPGYFLAKRIIRLIEGIASVVNADTRVNGWMRVAFVPDYRVSLAETLIPAADLSEQISTAGSEASGTGNMKFAINGALTIGTLDGATIEMRDEIGAENIFVFGHTAEQVAALKAEGAYDPKDWLARQSRLARVLDAIAADRFAEGEPGVDRPILEALLEQGDRYLHVADFADYADTEEHVEHAFIEPRSWQRKCLLNIARMGYFSSDRTILEYARDIWGLRA